MGLYYLYHNLSTQDQNNWSMQSTLTCLLAEAFTSIKCEQLNSNLNLFNNLCVNFRDKLNFIDSIKFPMFFGPCLVPVNAIISVLCGDNLITQKMTCLSCENIVSNLFQTSLNQHVWLKYAE